MLGDQAVIVDAKHVEPGHVVNVVGVGAVANLTLRAHHHDVTLSNDRDDGRLDQGCYRPGLPDLAEELDEGGAATHHIRIVLDVGLGHVPGRLVEMPSLVHDAPEIKHELLVVGQPGIGALQHGELVRRGLRWNLGVDREQQAGQYNPEKQPWHCHDDC